jgi:hypothetical protein
MALKVKNGVSKMALRILYLQRIITHLKKKAGWKQSLGKDSSTSVKVGQKKNRVTKTSNKKPKSDGKEKNSQKKDVAKQKISKINKSKVIKTAEKAVVFSLLPRTNEQKDLMSMSWQGQRAHDLVEWGHWYVETYIKK